LSLLRASGNSEVCKIATDWQRRETNVREEKHHASARSR
jgi:hypothetical protein